MSSVTTTSFSELMPLGLGLGDCVLVGESDSLSIAEDVEKKETAFRSAILIEFIDIT